MQVFYKPVNRGLLFAPEVRDVRGRGGLDAEMQKQVVHQLTALRLVVSPPHFFLRSSEDGKIEYVDRLEGR